MNTKYVRVMADYSSDGLWQHDGTMMERDELPISHELRTRHEEWCNWYEGSVDYPRVAFDYISFSKEGKEIAQAIKKELPDWTVIYFDEAASLTRNNKTARENYEYEIK